jgi:hypothetical protein
LFTELIRNDLILIRRNAMKTILLIIIIVVIGLYLFITKFEDSDIVHEHKIHPNETKDNRHSDVRRWLQNNFWERGFNYTSGFENGRWIHIKPHAKEHSVKCKITESGWEVTVITGNESNKIAVKEDKELLEFFETILS